MEQFQVDFQINKDTPLMFIISGPSGVGKDSVLRLLKKRNLPIRHVVTANTRKPRPDEVEGIETVESLDDAEKIDTINNLTNR